MLPRTLLTSSLSFNSLLLQIVAGYVAATLFKGTSEVLHLSFALLVLLMLLVVPPVYLKTPLQVSFFIAQVHDLNTFPQLFEPVCCELALEQVAALLGQQILLAVGPAQLHFGFNPKCPYHGQKFGEYALVLDPVD